ncbi:MAG: xanthine dehydrogenase family protein molybdopterin-binding subunit [Deltaproteobacteria bacterium]|nr:xanthine dehydrogenase family protein molybdopterin-binding subunit [Deltaproteobacteria bacterium]
MSEEISRMKEMLDNLGADKYPRDEYLHIGKRGPRRVDGLHKAGGRADYTMDVQLPGMLYMRFLTSPYPHAKILSLDTVRAEGAAGVRAVLRYDDPELPESADLGGHVPQAEPVIPGTVHFQGQECGAAVAAETEDLAEEALRLIHIEWEVRPFVLEAEEASKPEAPLAYPELFSWGNVYNEVLLGEAFSDIKKGDVEKGFAEAEKIVEFRSERRLHTWIGPERPCGVFRWNGDTAEIWVKQQRPHIAKRLVSTWFGIPTTKILVHCLYQGASFGGWSQVSWNFGGHYCAALLARRTGRPVKWTFTRREDFFGGEMDEGTYTLKVGAKKDGTITAVEGRAVLANQQWPVFHFLKHLVENTRIPNLYGKFLTVMTNKGPNVPTRCEQNANTHTQSLVFDHIANALNLDPTEVALKNDGAFGHDTEWLNQQKKERGFQVRDSLKECIEKGKKAIDWDNKWHPPGTKKLPNGRMHGLAFTWAHEWDDSGGSSEMAIRIERNDGTASILAMGCDNGVDAENSYCRIAADELGMKLEDVYYNPRVDPGFFRMTPDSSTNMAVNGFAIRNAARILKRQILEAAAAPVAQTQRGIFPSFFPETKPEDLDIRDSLIYLKKDPSKRVSLAEFVGPSKDAGPMSGNENLGLRTPFSLPLFAYGYHVQDGTYNPEHLYTKFCRQAHFMEVEVDPETGEVIVTQVVNVNDVGKAINPMSCHGQQYGGTYMGVGRGLTEEVIYDPVTGVMLNGNLLDYKISTILDIDGPIETILVETGLGYGPYGVVGIGEDIGTVVPALLGPAVFNALGVWIDDFPITPNRILKALGKA